MAARRIIYFVLLAIAAVLHYAYGQYVTHYMLLFLLLAPVLSVLMSLPAALSSRAELLNGEDVCRGRESRVRMNLSCSFIIPPEGWNITIDSVNLFTGRVFPTQKVRFGSERNAESMFPADTTEIGCIRYTIKRAWVYDYLGLIPIPVKRGGTASVYVFPDKEQPSPDPELVEKSARALKPKPQGYSEEHELREYHEGDPVNLIHWKLSYKYDEYILREPQDVVRQEIVLVIEPPPRYLLHRSVLEQLSYLNEVLAEKRIPYELIYGKKQVRIESEYDYTDFMRGVLSERMQTGLALSPSMLKDALIYRIWPGMGGGK